jgi:Sec-independent protein translocase protein TatA
MFGLGMSELILLGILALILIGPKQLPEVARTLGRFLNDLKRSADGLTEDIKKQARVDLDLDSLDPRKPQKEPPPIPIMKDPRLDKTPPPVEENKPTCAADFKMDPPDQMTFAFNPAPDSNPATLDVSENPLNNGPHSTTTNSQSNGEKKE